MRSNIRRQALNELRKDMSDAHIKNVLGIDVNDLGRRQLSEGLDVYILREQLLYEGFLESIEAYATNLKNKTREKLSKTDAFITTLKKMITDATGKTMQSFIYLSKSKIINPILKKVSKFLENLKATPQFANIANGLIAKLNAFWSSLSSLQEGWKAVLIITSVAALCSYVYKQFSDIIDSVTQITQSNELLAQLGKLLSQNIIDSVISHATDINSYLSFIGSLSGGIDFAIETFSSVTSRITRPFA